MERYECSGTAWVCGVVSRTQPIAQEVDSDEDDEENVLLLDDRLS